MKPIEQALQIELANGETRIIELSRFPAMDGWDIQHRYLEFVSTSDKSIRRNYTLEVLSYASVAINDVRMPINTSAVVESHLQSWEAVEQVFEAVLRHNGIDPATHAERPDYWANAGGEMAVAFIAAASNLVGPAMELAGRQAAEQQPQEG